MFATRSTAKFCVSQSRIRMLPVEGFGILHFSFAVDSSSRVKLLPIFFVVVPTKPPFSKEVRLGRSGLPIRSVPGSY
jgi:hypothetical protein